MTRILCVVALAAMFLSLHAQADSAVELSKLGAYQGNQLCARPAAVGWPFYAQFGTVWTGPAYVYSMDLSLVDLGQGLPQTFHIYTSPTEFKTFTWSPSSPVVNFETLFGAPIYANNSYVLLVPQGLPGATANDPHFGMGSFSFVTAATGKVDTNLNRAPGTVITPSRGPDWEPLGLLANDIIDSHNNKDAPFWETRHGGFSVTAKYDEPQWVGSIGLGFSGDAENRTRPVSVTVRDEHGNWQTFTIGAEACQYGRFDLDPTIFTKKIQFLTLEVPNNWVGGAEYVGITEFQAFLGIPEPVTMSLLAVGGLALLRRRRK